MPLVIFFGECFFACWAVGFINVLMHPRATCRHQRRDAPFLPTPRSFYQYPGTTAKSVKISVRCGGCAVASRRGRVGMLRSGRARRGGGGPRPPAAPSTGEQGVTPFSYWTAPFASHWLFRSALPLRYAARQREGAMMEIHL